MIPSCISSLLYHRKLVCCKKVYVWPTKVYVWQINGGVTPDLCVEGKAETFPSRGYRIKPTTNQKKTFPSAWFNLSSASSNTVFHLWLVWRYLRGKPSRVIQSREAFAAPVNPDWRVQKGEEKGGQERRGEKRNSVLRRLDVLRLVAPGFIKHKTVRGKALGRNSALTLSQPPWPLRPAHQNHRPYSHQSHRHRRAVSRLRLRVDRARHWV
jgi:hypothetical protein